MEALCPQLTPKTATKSAQCGEHGWIPAGAISRPPCQALFSSIIKGTGNNPQGPGGKRRPIRTIRPLANDRIGFCLRAVHQKFTIVLSPNT
jgi:hypothetical protein